MFPDMFFKTWSIWLLLAITSSSTAIAIDSRQAKESITLFVYGSDVNGAPLFYADGKAYFGHRAINETTVTQTNVTVAPADDITTPWSVAANSSTMSFNETLYMALNPTTTSQLEFTPAANMTAGFVDTGLTWFGTAVAYAADESNYGLSFAGVATNTSGVYGLYYTVGTSTVEGSFPVSVKSTVPVAP